ncbi:hypothetical protein [Chondrinema litorale]|uniref:hypothetical protein n=1 Tax=Chondrinema litorale TaxID=2994555 RepID=UPI0025434A53|nr:hypothetical protein [Chondrinema litorale]UZR98175.1 hypothetical protein OQ292_29695 [Chondrinema litorale]
MSEKSSLYEQIEKYLNKELIEAEHAEFEQKMQQDKALKKEVLMHKEMASSLGDEHYQQLINTLENLQNPDQFEAENKKIINANYLRFGIAASVVFVMLLGLIFLLNKTQTYSGDQLFVAYFEPYQVDAFRSADENNEMSDAMKAYQNRDYEKAVSLFEQTPATDISTIDNFYWAIALLATDSGNEAIEKLDDLKSENAMPGLAQNIDWYLALANLQVGKLKEAKAILESISENEQHYKNKAATELLNKL